MSRSTVVSIAVCISAATAPAQGTVDFHPFTTVQDAGTFHVSTGTWTRSRGGQANLGPDTIYSNNFNTGFFAGPVTNTQQITDFGRVPSTSAVPNAGAVDSYDVNGFQVAYCTRQDTANFDLTLNYYNDYAECIGESASVSGVVASFIATGGAFPASTLSGTLACWVVTVDLENSTATFCITADVDGAFNTGGAEDKFGWSFLYGNVAGGIAGPIISGSCSPLSNAPGQGTYYDTPSATTTTGLGTNDFFWIQDSLASAGCFFFGGCNGNDSNPYASFWQLLFADTSSGGCFGNPCGGTVGTCFCPSSLNSTGTNGVLSAAGSNQVGGMLSFTAAPIPNTSGLLFFGPNQLPSTPDFGEGIRCVGGQTRRVFPVGLATGNTRTVALDPGAGYYSSIMSGAQSNFQYWFREAMNAGDLDGDGMVEPFNTTNSVGIDFQ